MQCSATFAHKSLDLASTRHQHSKLTRGAISPTSPSPTTSATPHPPRRPQPTSTTTLHDPFLRIHDQQRTTTQDTAPHDTRINSVLRTEKGSKLRFTVRLHTFVISIKLVTLQESKLSIFDHFPRPPTTHPKPETFHLSIVTWLTVLLFLALGAGKELKFDSLSPEWTVASDRT